MQLIDIINNFFSTRVFKHVQGFFELSVCGDIQNSAGHVPEQSKFGWPCWTGSPPEVLPTKLLYDSMKCIGAVVTVREFDT